MLDQLVNSNALKISRFPDFDHFRSIEKLGDARSIPLRWKEFDPCVAAVTLKSCSIFLQRTFPRILQARYRSPGAIICLAMDDAVSAILDGVEARAPSLLLIKGETACEFVEPQANLLAFIIFDSIEHLDWPGEVGRAQLVATRPADMAVLRSVIREILLFASNSAGLLLQPHTIAHVENSLLGAVDRMLSDPSLSDGAPRADFSKYLQMVRRLDELLQHDAAQPIHSVDIARQFEVSVRTLNNAVETIRGLSLRRYIGLRRMWNVRQQLVQGPSAERVKAIALANGFWHMGEFRAVYREIFGETPRQTLDGSGRQ
jgi:AraC-like DNA-binding protein